MPPDILTVKHITAYLQALCEADDLLGDVWVQGEVSNFKRASSGHCYFSLKEAKATLRAVMWRGHADKLTTLPQNGDEVVVHGSLSFYEVGGDIQLYGDALIPAGMGILYARFEACKTRLLNEGLFDESRKRPLPKLPHRIGVATSADGAALRDIVQVLRRRFPLGEVIISPCMVQGEKAPASIVEALHRLYALPQPVDLIILARGGGALEDLWSFNDETVARAVYASPVPLITGVGHETDTTIVDYVADLRAPTPSAAAEIATPNLADMVNMVVAQRERLHTTMQALLATQRKQIDAWYATILQYRFATYLTRSRQQVDDLVQQATRLMGDKVKLAHARFEGLHRHMQSLSPFATLERGYALVRQAATGGVITQVQQVAVGDELTLVVQDGEIVVTVVQVTTPNPSGSRA